MSVNRRFSVWAVWDLVGLAPPWAAVGPQAIGIFESRG